MISRLNAPFAEEVISELDTKIVGKDIYYFETIDSTNLFARKLVKDDVEEGVVVVADTQSSGRGRKNRIWSSLKGGLWFSVVLYPKISPQDGMFITMASSVAVAEGIKKITGLNSIIKWPNDILINGKKVCGILTEIDAEKDNINYAVIGIGINVNNQLDKELQKTATTLRQETSAQVSKVKLLISILKSLDENYNRLILSDYNFIRDLWLSYSNIIGKKIQIKDEITITTGVVTNIDNNGYLILDTDCGKIRIVSGDVEYL